MFAVTTQFAVDKPVVVTFFGNERPLEILAEQILHISYSTVIFGHSEMCLHYWHSWSIMYAQNMCWCSKNCFDPWFRSILTFFLAVSAEHNWLQKFWGAAIFFIFYFWSIPLKFIRVLEKYLKSHKLTSHKTIFIVLLLNFFFITSDQIRTEVHLKIFKKKHSGLNVKLIYLNCI